MNYDDFVCYVQAAVQQKMGEEVRVSLHQVPKNNGIRLDGLAITDRESGVSPTIYLEDFFREYEGGLPVFEVVEHIVKLYGESKVTVPVDLGFYQEFEQVKDHVVCKLINYEKNKALLEKIPHVRYLDLAIVFYYLMVHEEMGSGTILIYRSHLDMWKVTEEELYQVARRNTADTMPFTFFSMYEVIEELLGEGTAEEECQDGGFPMYVLTNEERSLGAVEMIFDSSLAQVGDQLQEDFFILPSSIHEVIVVPVSAAPVREELEEMVRDINSTQVLPQEVLSDHVYYYQWKKHSLNL